MLLSYKNLAWGVSIKNNGSMKLAENSLDNHISQNRKNFLLN